MIKVKTKTILFDLDGTLIDSTEAILESFGVAFETFGTSVPEDESIKKLIGHPLDLMFTMLGVDVLQADAYVGAYKEHYRLISRQKTTLLPLAYEAITYASQIATLGIVTTKTARYSQDLLEHMGVMHHFKVLIGRENVTHPKPHPEPIQKALAALGSDPSRTWMVGDTPMDILCAKEAGVQSVGVLCGYASRYDLRPHTDCIVRDALDAVKLIAQVS